MGSLPLLLLLLDLGIAMALQDTDNIDILQGLGLTRLPDMTKANISQAEWSRMTELYLQRVAARRAEAEAEGVPSELHDQQQLFTFRAAGPTRSRRSIGRGARRNPRTRLRMHLPADTEVDQAEIRVFVEEPGTVRVFESEGRRLVSQLNVSSAGWTQLDVADPARRAALDGRPLLLELRCARCQDAALNVLAEPASHKRAKRAALTDCGKDGMRCCRHAMEVEFAQIPGMEFIMQPKRFDAGFCRGRCPPRFHPAHHHALIQGLLRRRGVHGGQDPPRGPRVPRPCCAPKRLQPLDVLYVDEDNPTKLKLAEWSEMKVLNCACA